MIMLLLTTLFQAGCETNRTASPQQDEAALSDKPAPISDENTQTADNAEKSGIRLAGLVEKNGMPHALKGPDPTKGRTINVQDFGADPADNGKDDRPFIQQAIDAARAGDEVYIPDGVYELYGLDPVNRDTQLLLKSGIHLRGESRENTILLSDLANRPGSKDNGASSAGGSDASVIHAKRSVNILISNLTITSSWNGTYPTNYKVNNPSRGGPKIGINLLWLSWAPRIPSSSTMLSKRPRMTNLGRSFVTASRSNMPSIRW
jgi:hypothetical protein